MSSVQWVNIYKIWTNIMIMGVRRTKFAIKEVTYDLARDVLSSLPWSPSKAVLNMQLKPELSKPATIPSVKRIFEENSKYTQPNTQERKELFSTQSKELILEINDSAQYERIFRLRLNNDKNMLETLKEDKYILHQMMPKEGDAENELETLINAGWVLLEPSSKGSLIDKIRSNGYLLRSGYLDFGNREQPFALINFKIISLEEDKKHFTINLYDSSYENYVKEWISKIASAYKSTVYTNMVK